MFSARPNSRLHAHRLPSASKLACALLFLATSRTPAQSPSTDHLGDPVSWVQAAAANELPIIDNAGNIPLRYRLHKIDAKGDTVREIIESREGTVSRTILASGQPLTHEADTAERNRLQAILNDPADFFKHNKRNNAARSYAMDLVRQMPRAMLFTYAPNQPQPATTTALGQQVVIDFHSDPAYKPPTTVSELLTGLEGRMWIDLATRHLTRIEGRIVKPVNLYGGLLVRIYPGGTVLFEQAPVGNGRWVYSNLDEHLTIREVMVHTAVQNTRESSADFRLLPTPISYKDAVNTLLAMHIPLR